MALTPPELQALSSSFRCAPAMEGSPLTLTHLRTRAQRHWLPPSAQSVSGPDNGKTHRLNINPWCTRTSLCTAFWENWWSNSPALNKNSIILQESLKRIFLSIWEISCFIELYLRGDNLPRMPVGSSKRILFDSQNICGVATTPLSPFSPSGLPRCKLFFSVFYLKNTFWTFSDFIERF